jgi:putative oxidoreductase
MQSKIATGARWLLGLIYFVFGLNGLLNFLPCDVHGS